MSNAELIAYARRVVELTGVRQSTILIDKLADALETADADLQDWEDNGAPAWIAARERMIVAAKATAWAAGVEFGWELSGEGVNHEIACESAAVFFGDQIENPYGEAARD